MSAQVLQLSDEQLEQLAALVAERTSLLAGPRLLTAEEVAPLLGVPKSWVLSQARADAMPHVRLGKYPRFERDEVIEWFRTTAHHGPKVTR